MPSLIMPNAITNVSDQKPAVQSRTKSSLTPTLIFSIYCHLGGVVWLHILVDNTRFGIVRRHHPRSVEATLKPIGIPIPASPNLQYIVAIGNLYLIYRMMIVQDWGSPTGSQPDEFPIRKAVQEVQPICCNRCYAPQLVQRLLCGRHRTSEEAVAALTACFGSIVQYGSATVRAVPEYLRNDHFKFLDLLSSSVVHNG